MAVDARESNEYLRYASTAARGTRQTPVAYIRSYPSALPSFGIKGKEKGEEEVEAVPTPALCASHSPPPLTNFGRSLLSMKGSYALASRRTFARPTHGTALPTYPGCGRSYASFLIFLCPCESLFTERVKSPG